MRLIRLQTFFLFVRYTALLSRIKFKCRIYKEKIRLFEFVFVVDLYQYFICFLNLEEMILHVLPKNQLITK